MLPNLEEHGHCTVIRVIKNKAGGADFEGVSLLKISITSPKEGVERSARKYSPIRIGLDIKMWCCAHGY